MKTLSPSLLVAIGALTLAGTAFAQVPSTNDTSDANANTGMGHGALGGPATTNPGSGNTASGYDALISNSAGNNNTGTGYAALGSNTNGHFNTAIGYESLYSNQASYNTASGWSALFNNTTGTLNTASGVDALYSNTTGNNNTASGVSALHNNTLGINNTAAGYAALYRNTTGNDNTAAGDGALYYNTTGSGNIAVGFQAGSQVTPGSNNIDIGSKGLAADGDTIRIGSPAQKTTFIAGIFGTSVTGSAVVVNSNGKLGVTVSSERYKTDVAPMGANTVKLEQLRPVTFRLKTDPKGALQYGLIAEEVAKVYPELVIRGEKGRIDGVRYDELAPMLLNEMQKRNAAQDAEIRDLKHEMAELKALNQATQVALRKLQAKDEFVAQR